MKLREEISTTKKKKDTKAREETTSEYYFDRLKTRLGEIYRINRFTTRPGEMKTPGMGIPSALYSSVFSVPSVAEKNYLPKGSQRKTRITRQQIQAKHSRLFPYLTKASFQPVNCVQTHRHTHIEYAP